MNCIRSTRFGVQRLAMSKFTSEFDGINGEVNALRKAHTHARTKAARAARDVSQMQENIEGKVQEREVSCITLQDSVVV